MKFWTELNNAHFEIISIFYKKCYYTLYFFSKPIYDFNKQKNGIMPHNPYLYRKNLSIDAETAIEKVMNFNSKLPILFLPEDELNKIIKYYSKNILWFGKYTGRDISDIFEEDKNYFWWLFKNLRDSKMTIKQENLYHIMKEIVEAWHEEKTIKNQTEILSEYLSEDKIKDFEATVISVKPGDEDSLSVKLKDDNNHYFSCYLHKECKYGDILKIKSARIVRRYENTGIKYHYINYVKF